MRSKYLCGLRRRRRWRSIFEKSSIVGGLTPSTVTGRGTKPGGESAGLLVSITGVPSQAGVVLVLGSQLKGGPVQGTQEQSNQTVFGERENSLPGGVEMYLQSQNILTFILISLSALMGQSWSLVLFKKI